MKGTGFSVLSSERARRFCYSYGTIPTQDSLEDPSKPYLNSGLQTDDEKEIGESSDSVRSGEESEAPVENRPSQGRIRTLKA